MPLMDWPALLGRPLPTGAERIAYGPSPEQVADLWLPAGKGPFPVVLMVHGGCWLSDVAKLTIMNYAAEDLRRRGYAVWNIEYRGVDRPGGGYPGTFEDVAAGADALGRIAAERRLDLGRLVAFGHSAGGHLVLWLAARAAIPASSPLHAAAPLKLTRVVSSGGLPDLEEDHRQGVCGATTIETLTGAATAARPNVYADTSPAALAALPDEAVLVNGAEDDIAPPALGADYLAKMRARGARIRQIVEPDTGHVELIAPGTAVWTKTVGAIDALAR